ARLSTRGDGEGVEAPAEHAGHERRQRRLPGAGGAAEQQGTARRERDARRGTNSFVGDVDTAVAAISEERTEAGVVAAVGSVRAEDGERGYICAGHGGCQRLPINCSWSWEALSSCPGCSTGSSQASRPAAVPGSASLQSATNVTAANTGSRHRSSIRSRSLSASGMATSTG